MSSKQIRSGAKAPGHRRHIVGRLMGYIKRGYKARFIIVLVCILVSAIANVAGSLFLGSLIDDYITPLLGAADPDFSGLVRALVMMGCLFLVGALCAYAYNRNMIVVSQGVQKTIRDDLFGHMQTLPIKYFDTHAHDQIVYPTKKERCRTEARHQVCNRILNQVSFGKQIPPECLMKNIDQMMKILLQEESQKEIAVKEKELMNILPELEGADFIFSVPSADVPAQS